MGVWTARPHTRPAHTVAIPQTAPTRIQMCFHASARPRGLAVSAQHFGQAGETVCEPSSRLATVEVPCEFLLVSF
jgi:hypothetical protein